MGSRAVLIVCKNAAARARFGAGVRGAGGRGGGGVGRVVRGGRGNGGHAALGRGGRTGRAEPLIGDDVLPAGGGGAALWVLGHGGFLPMATARGPLGTAPAWW